MALTATAGPMVVRDICNTLCIPLVEEPSTRILYDASGVKVLNCNRDNIDVYTMLLQSNDERQYLLQKILKRAKDEKCERTAKKLPIEAGCLSKGNVIIYVWRQKDTEIVAEQLIGAGVSGGIVCYHGGMEYNDRAKAQNKVSLASSWHKPKVSIDLYSMLFVSTSSYEAKLEYVLQLSVSALFNRSTLQVIVPSNCLFVC
jgi:ATP-dependent DNA helicase Q4